ncbi:DMT family transporter [Actinomyces slackii]|uniref:Carboxylate/amino acid/amine transporter n=1 Tax=Actinomyces slackii TaxID=52774 RepID=A0A3S4SH28_9ACTO|nr:DMT family transporter [Actinomyces slackii]VEG75855.1 carboxylate/amino acid/amine transporter [Actinomyces slackii]
MRFGIISGCLWGLDTVVLGIALAMSPFLGAGQASLTGALLHDAISAIILLVYMGARGRLRHTLEAARTGSGKAVMAGAVMGGPVGMTGYLIAINNIGPGYTAIISTFYPAVGTLLAFLLLKERMRPRQIVALMVALAAIIVIGWSSSTAQTPGSPVIGVVAALACVLGWGSEAVILAWGMRDDKVDNETALHIRQTVSGLSYLVVVAPVAGIIGFTAQATVSPSVGVVFLASLAGAVSYLFYFQAIAHIGASRGMALNISYSAWAVVFALVLLGTVPTVLDVVCCIVILAGTVLAATPDLTDLLPRRSRVPKDVLAQVSGQGRGAPDSEQPEQPELPDNPMGSAHD